ncbi:hypothetical protein [Falsiroseomonas sp. HW251]|uniref:hypothetical protein n=1 Tax=Falsiroseomonas sp. HW251 TaxID=3390998 RepID=UPI003D31DD3E
MTGPGLRAAAALLALTATAARADCFDWDMAGALLHQGTLRGLPPGPVQWRAGTRPVGGDHSETAVELRWTQGGRSVRQSIFAELQDGTPALRVVDGQLRLRVSYCERYGRCRQVTLPYRWDRAAGRFAGADRNARESLEAVACQPDETG